jgi:adenosylcobinamide kinase/adenosylcobinamide-phosphate guanylyltransferase
MKTLLLGGARSGKSTLASRWASERSSNVCALVTAAESDPEMTARIAAHRQARPAHWRVREELVQLGAVLRQESAAQALMLVDCLTLWISNCLWPPALDTLSIPDESGWRAQRDDFLAALAGCRGEVIVVSNEVGAGIVPDNAAARLFRDEQGWLNQSVAALCDEVYWVTAGLALRLKP